MLCIFIRIICISKLTFSSKSYLYNDAFFKKVLKSCSENRFESNLERVLYSIAGLHFNLILENSYSKTCKLIILKVPQFLSLPTHTGLVFNLIFFSLVLELLLIVCNVVYYHQNKRYFRIYPMS